MYKQLILAKYKKPEDKILVSKIFDKIEICNKTGKIINTDFVDPMQKRIVENVFNQIKFKNYIFYGGGLDEAQRNVIIIYPDKFDKIMNLSFDFNSILKTIRIILPQELKSEFEHRTYLGGLMKLGIKREKIGDIVTYRDGADIIVSVDIIKFITNNLSQLTRFNKCKIEIIKNEQIHKSVQEYKDMKIVLASFRLDNVISELLNTSRGKANEIIHQERVFVNYENELKLTKLIKINDIISIRGKGKYIIVENEGMTRSGRYVVKIKQFQ